ncbi:MAG: PAS domain S-box protein, partial [Ignavibacteria bacterium]|nr:PAS domain S-box protein [Ignavibacteria bacterium]
STVWVDVSLSFVRDSNGKPIEIFAVSRDITVRKKLEFEKERTSQIQEALNKVLNISIEDIPIEESLQKILEVLSSLPFLSTEQRGAIFLADDEQSSLLLKVHRNFATELQSVCLQIPFGQCLCGKAAETRQIQYTDNIDERHEMPYPVIKPHGHYNVPILSKDKVLGVIVLYLDAYHKQETYEKEFLLSVSDILSGLILRKKSEMLMQQSEARYRQLFENSPIGIFRTTPDGEILAANSALLKMLNYSSLEHIRTINLELQSYTSYARILFKEKLENEGRIVGLEANWKKSDGTEITVHENATIVRDDEGRILYYDGTVEDITERKLAEEALRFSEQKFRTLAENIPDHIIRYDLEGHIVYLNHEEEQKRFFSAPLLDKLPVENHSEQPKILEEYQKKLLRVIAFGGEEVIEIFLPDPDSRIHVYEVHFVAERDRENKIIGAMAIGHEITERKQYERELINAKRLIEESERKFKAIANQATEGIALADTDGKYVFVNPAFCLMVGYSVEELLNMTVFDLRSETQTHDVFVESKTSKLGQPIRVNLRRKDGTEFITEIIGSMVKIEGKNLILGTVRDITERTKMEEALLESEEKYRLIAENTADTIAVFDMNLRYLYVSPSVINLLGYTPDEMMSLSLEYIMSPTSWKNVQQTYNEEIANELSVTADPNRSKVFITEQYRKDGTKIWVEGTASFVRDATGKPVNILAISKDITDRKAAVDALKKSEIRVRALVEQSP